MRRVLAVVVILASVLAVDVAATCQQYIVDESNIGANGCARQLWNVDVNGHTFYEYTVLACHQMPAATN